LDTIRSRCLRLNFAGQGQRSLDPGQMAWLNSFSDFAATDQKSLLGRYSLLDVLLRRLNELKKTIEDALTAASPIERYKDAEPHWQEKWEDELKAAIEAEYRRQRADLLVILQSWLRDVWLLALNAADKNQRPDGGNRPQTLRHELLNFPEVPGTQRIAQRISSTDALQNLTVLEQLQRCLGGNVQEALALEVSLLQLRL